MQNQNITIKLKNLTQESGVYKMLDKSGNVIYVGKAKNLKNRVSNYFNKSSQDEKTQLLQKNIYDFSITLSITSLNIIFCLKILKVILIFISVTIIILGLECIEERRKRIIITLDHTHLSMQQGMLLLF